MKRNANEEQEEENSMKKLKFEGQQETIQEPILSTIIPSQPPPSSSSSSSSSGGMSTNAETNAPVATERMLCWFDRNTIHTKELECFPEYFTNNRPKATPMIYKTIRNEIIDFYEKDPKSFLTFTTLRQNLLGDVCTIMKIYDFLNAHDIINYDTIQLPYVKTSVINEFIPFDMYENPQEAEKLIKSLRAKKEKENNAIESIYDLYDETGNPKVAIEEIKKLAKARIEELKITLEKQVEEYMEFRYKILEQKARLLDQVEVGFSLEHEELEANRRDNQVTRAYISYINSHQ